MTPVAPQIGKSANLYCVSPAIEWSVQATYASFAGRYMSGVILRLIS